MESLSGLQVLVSTEIREIIPRFLVNRLQYMEQIFILRMEIILMIVDEKSRYVPFNITSKKWVIKQKTFKQLLLAANINLLAT